MHYINTEAMLAVMKAQFGTNARAEEICRTHYIPLMNDAYRAGKAGEPGYPMDPAEEIAAFKEVHGPLTDGGGRVITAFIHCLNAAYAQGKATRNGKSRT